MLVLVLSWLAPLLGLCAFWFSVKHPWGWTFGIVQSVVYATLGLCTGAWGLVILSPVYVLIFTRNFILDEKALKKKLAKKAAKAAKKAEREAKYTCELGGSYAQG